MTDLHRSPLHESDARRIASEWHGGQASPLYAFSSTGTILPGLLSEINQCIRESSGHDDIDELRLLRTYINQRTED
jgi:hypothetical protein